MCRGRFIKDLNYIKINNKLLRDIEIYSIDSAIVKNDMAISCPYCSNYSNIDRYIEFNLYNEDYKEDFFKSAYILKCIEKNCGKDFYAIRAKMESASEHIEIYLTIEEFKRLEREFSDNLLLISFLPKNIADSYTEMVKVFQQECGLRSMSALLRVTIEAYTLYKKKETNKDITEIKDSLRKEIFKLSHLSDNTKKILSDIIIAETQYGAHIKSTLPDIEILKKGYLFLEFLFTKEFKIPKELELAKEKYEHQIEFINKQLDVLEKVLIDSN